MKKVYIQIVDILSGISQNGVIEEPVSEGLEIQNALAHFSVGGVNWFNEYKTDTYETKCGQVVDTSKIVNVVVRQSK